MKTTTNFSVPTIGNFTDKLNFFWLEMRSAVSEAIRAYGRETVNEIVKDDRFIVLNGDEIEFQGTADDVATEVDSLFSELREIGGWQYYEVDFFRSFDENGNRPDPEDADADYSMLIKAWHKPTIEEAEEWLKSDMEKYHEKGVLRVVGPVTEQEIAGCYDMDHNIVWPIHGKKGEVSAPPAPTKVVAKVDGFVDLPDEEEKPAEKTHTDSQPTAAKYYHTNLTADSVRGASTDEIRKFMDDNWDDICGGINEIIYSKEFLDKVVRPMVRDMLEDYEKSH